MKFNKIEKEIIFLKAIKELIDDMVNYEVVKLLGNDPHSEVHFNSMTHQKYFNIILLDFLSCSDKKVLGEQLSYLEALQSICESPSFNKNNSIKSLSARQQLTFTIRHFYLVEFDSSIRHEIYLERD